MLIGCCESFYFSDNMVMGYREEGRDGAGNLSCFRSIVGVRKGRLGGSRRGGLRKEREIRGTEERFLLPL